MGLPCFGANLKKNSSWENEECCKCVHIRFKGGKTDPELY